jgi:outer membrane receptor for ferrienterochelin and colicins
MKIKILFLFCLISFISQAQEDSISTIGLKEVVVTGQFEPQSLRQSVYQVRLISSEQIQNRAATSVQGILNTELGVRISNDLTLGTSDISLMGMSGQNVKILLDGIPLVDRGATRESLGQIDMRMVERIEIVEGPMSVMYGPDALAGVINIITKKGFDGSGYSLEASVQEETIGKTYSAFANDGLHNENINGVWQGKRWHASGGITRNNSGGWKETRELDPGYREWHPKAQWLGNGSFGYGNDHFNIWYRLNYVNENILSEENTYNDPNTGALMGIDKEYITNRYTHQLQTEWKISERWNINAVASYQDYSRRTLTTSVNMETGDRRLYVNEAGGQDKSKFESQTLRATALYKFTTDFSVQGGIDINLNTGAGDRIDGTRSINDYAVFLSPQFSVGKKISVRPGVRFTYNSVYDAPPVIPSVNTKIILSDRLDLRLSYARGFRAPALRELYFSFHDANHDIDGNPDLKAEFSNSVTGSLAWQAFKSETLLVKSTLGGFYNQFENMITLGSISSEDPNHFTYINVFKNKATGTTLNNSFTSNKFNINLGFSYIGVYNEFSEQDAALPAILWTPEINTTATVYFDKFGSSLSVFYKVTGAQSSYRTVTVDFEPQVMLGKIDAYHWADITFTKKITQQLDLTSGVRNLFDVVQVNSTVSSGGTHTTAGPMPVGYGRSYFASLRFKLSKNNKS